MGKDRYDMGETDEGHKLEGRARRYLRGGHLAAEHVPIKCRRFGEIRSGNGDMVELSKLVKM